MNVSARSRCSPTAPWAWQGLMVAAVGSWLAAAPPLRASNPGSRVVEVPNRPAFVRPPAGREIPARPGQTLAMDTVLRTTRPGRLQVRLGNGREFRLGGDAVLKLGATGLNLQRGQIIAWVHPGNTGGSPFTIRTRAATASIVGTTVFIDASDDSLKIFSWEGHVRVETAAGRRYDLHSGEQLSIAGGIVQPVKRLSSAEASARRQQSILLNGFVTPMQTLPVIERALGIAAPAAAGHHADPPPSR